MQQKQHQMETMNWLSGEVCLQSHVLQKSELYPRSSCVPACKQEKDFKNSTVFGIHVEKKNKQNNYYFACSELGYKQLLHKMHLRYNLQRSHPLFTKTLPC